MIAQQLMPQLRNMRRETTTTSSDEWNQMQYERPFREHAAVICDMLLELETSELLQLVESKELLRKRAQTALNLWREELARQVEEFGAELGIDWGSEMAGSSTR